MQFHERGIFDTAWGYEVIAAYEDGLEIRMVEGDKGMRWVGTEGWIDLADEGQLTAQPASILDRTKLNVHWSVVAQHHRNWLDCVKTLRPARRGRRSLRIVRRRSVMRRTSPCGWAATCVGTAVRNVL